LSNGETKASAEESRQAAEDDAKLAKNAREAAEGEAKLAKAARKAAQNNCWGKAATVCTAVAALAAIAAVGVANCQLTTITDDARVTFSYEIFKDLDNAIAAFVHNPGVGVAFKDGTFNAESPPPEGYLLIRLYNTYNNAYILREKSPGLVSAETWNGLTKQICKTLKRSEYAHAIPYLQTLSGGTTNVVLEAWKKC